MCYDFVQAVGLIKRVDIEAKIISIMRFYWKGVVKLYWLIYLPKTLIYTNKKCIFAFSLLNLSSILNCRVILL